MGKEYLDRDGGAAVESGELVYVKNLLNFARHLENVLFVKNRGGFNVQNSVWAKNRTHVNFSKTLLLQHRSLFP